MIPMAEYKNISISMAKPIYYSDISRCANSFKRMRNYDNVIISRSISNNNIVGYKYNKSMYDIVKNNKHHRINYYSLFVPEIYRTGKNAKSLKQIIKMNSYESYEIELLELRRWYNFEANK